MALDPFYEIDPTDLARLMSEPTRNYGIFDTREVAESATPLDVVVGTWQQANARIATLRADQLATGDPAALTPMVIRVLTDEQLAAWNG